MRLHTIIFRSVISITQGAVGMLAKIQTYFYNKKSITTNVNILYQDGLYSVNKDSKILAIENDVKNLYSLLYQDTEALKIIKSIGLQEKDIFLGREGVYILLKNNDKKFTIKNNTTDLKTILTQNITIDNAFFNSLTTALSQADYNSFQASLKPSIADYISQKTAVNTLILSLLSS